MPAISPEQKQELRIALDQVTDLCAEGTAPDDAIIKVAQDMNLSADRLPFLVRSYNTGATAAHWSSSANQQEKIASFPIADIGRIRSRLFPTAVKTASSKKQPAVDNTFNMSAEALFGNCFERAPMQKSASMKSAKVIRKEDEDLAIRKAEAVQKQVEHIEDAAYLTKYAALEELDKQVELLAEDLRNPNAPDFKHMCKTACTLFPQLGAKLLAYTTERFPDIKQNRRLLKSAAVLTNDSAFYTHLQDAMKALTRYVNADSAYTTAVTKCAEASKQVAKQEKVDLSSLMTTPEEVRQKQLLKSSDYRYNSLNNYIQSTGGPAWEMASPAEQLAMTYMKDRTPIRNQHVRTLLLDLMNTDPYLREQDPDVIAAAFNDLYESNPVDATKRIWLKTNLPQYIASDRMDSSLLNNMLDSGRRAEQVEQDKQKSVMQEFYDRENLRLKRQDSDNDNRKLQMDTAKDARNEERAQAQHQTAAEAARRSDEDQSRLQDIKNTHALLTSKNNQRSGGNITPAQQALYERDLRTWQKTHAKGNASAHPYDRLMDPNSRIDPNHEIFSMELNRDMNPMQLQHLMDLYDIK